MRDGLTLKGKTIKTLYLLQLDVSALILNNCLWNRNNYFVFSTGSTKGYDEVVVGSKHWMECKR
jgi:hypothetical protein